MDFCQNKMEKIDLIRISIYRDGGTSMWMTPNEKERLESFGREHGIDSLKSEIEKSERYFLDNRIRSTTKGMLFDKYPSDIDAKQVDKKNFNLIK